VKDMVDQADFEESENEELRKRFGAGWAYKFIFSPKPIPLDIAEEISLKLKKQPRTSFNELLI
jgi:hypothetical protein